MTWNFYLFLLAFFSLVFFVFYAVAWSVLLGIRDNYRRYYQKSELQWTGPAGQSRRPGRPPLILLLPSALLTSWLVVHFIIRPS